MSNYKLTYFDARLRGEFIRLIFAAGGEKFTDDRIQIAEWQKDKEKFDTPLGKLPYLTVENVKIPQSMAVARFAAKKANLYGSDDLEQAKTDAVVDTVNELMNAYFQKIIGGKPEEKKAFFSDEVPEYLAKVEKLIRLWGSNGYSVGSSLKWSDLYIWEMSFSINSLAPDIIDKYPTIKAVRKSVEANQKVADYIRNRKPSPI